MTHRSRPLFPLMIAGLMATTMLASPAGQAQTAAGAATLKPTTGWSVTQIDGAATGAGPYCTLARQYDNGAILTLGRNTTEEYSLAVDFQEPRFDTDRAYKLSLQPGPGQVRAFEMLPVSESAMVVRLGWDESFFDSIKKSQALTVGISGEQYAFALPEFQSGQSDLSACMNKLKVAGNAGKPAGSKTDVLAADAGMADEGFSAKKVPNKTATVVADASAKAMNDMAPAAGAVALAAPKTSADSSALKSENERLTLALQTEKRKSAEQLADVQVTRNQINELQEKIRMLESGKGIAAAPVALPTAADDGSAKKMASLEKTIATLKAENDKLAVQAQKPADPKTDDSAVQKAQMLETELANAHANIDKLNADLAAAMKAIAAKPADVAAKTETKPDQQILAQLESLGNENKVLRAKLSAVEKVKAEAVATPKEDKALTAKISALEADVKAKSDALAATGKDSAELTSFKQKVSELNAQKATLERDANAARVEAQQLRVELNDIQTSTGTRADQNATLKLQIEKLKNQLSLKDSEARTYRNQLSALQQNGAEQTASAQQLNDMTPAAGAAAMAAPQKMAQKPAPAPLGQKKTMAAPTSAYLTPLQQTLGQAGIVLAGGVKRSASGVLGNDVEVYSWKTTNLHGRGEVWPMASGADFNPLISRHVENARARCPGDFAAVPTEQSATRAAYEIACVTQAGNSSASIFFYQDKGKFVAISHETAAEDMDIAMDARDRVAAKVR
jgi:hypothetical protein